MDPFPTKGIEYLLVIGYLALFVPFAWFISRIGRRWAGEPETSPAMPEPAETPWYALPAGFHLHRGHTWALPLGDNVFKVGMDEFAHRLIGEATALRLPEPGHRLRQGETGWQVHVNGDKVDLLSPVHGEVVEVNQRALGTPALAGEDPYGEGWLMKVRVPSHPATLRNLLPDRLAGDWISKSSEDLGAMLGGELGPVLQDGGVPVRGFARQLAGDGWTEIAAKLLLTA